MANKLETLLDYQNKYKGCDLALKNLYEISKGFEHSELTKDTTNRPYFSSRSFVNIRKRILNQINRKKIKNPNLKIRLDVYHRLRDLRQKYDYVIGYDGVDKDDPNICKSFIKLVLGKWDHDKYRNSGKRKGKIDKIKTFMVLNPEKVVKHLNGGMKNEIAVDKLFDLMENWIFNKSKDTELKEQYENLNFYIVADKHRTIVNKMNGMKINGFISSDPTIYEKFENQNFKLKQKLNLASSIKEFNRNFQNKYIAIINI